MIMFLRTAIILSIGSLFLSQYIQDHISSFAPPAPSSAGTMPLPAEALRGTPDLVLNADADGHFRAAVDINGVALRLLVDTGASMVALRYEDARAAGINPAPSDFQLKMATANGTGTAAPVRLAAFRFAQHVFYDVPALVMNQGAAQSSLMGMSLLRTFRSYEISGEQMAFHI